MSYTTVFEIRSLDESNIFPADIQLVIGVIVLAIGAGLLIARLVGRLRNLKRHVGIATTGLGLVIVFILVPSNAHRAEIAKTLYSLYKSESYEITEGIVKVLREQPEEGHAPGDLVSIRGTKFEFSYYRFSTAYRKTLSHGGHLKEGVHAKVYHVGNNILKIEIRSK